MKNWDAVISSIEVKNLLQGGFSNLEFVCIREEWLPDLGSEYINIEPLVYKYGKIQAGSVIFEEEVPFKLITSLPLNAGLHFRAERGLIILPSTYWNSFMLREAAWSESDWEILHKLYAKDLYPIKMLWEAFILIKRMNFDYIHYADKAFYVIHNKEKQILFPHILLKYFFIPSICSSPHYDEIYCTVSTFNEMLNRFDGNLSKYNSDAVAVLLSKEVPIPEIESIMNQLIVE